MFKVHESEPNWNCQGDPVCDWSEDKIQQECDQVACGYVGDPRCGYYCNGCSQFGMMCENNECVWRNQCFNDDIYRCQTSEDCYKSSMSCCCDTDYEVGVNKEYLTVFTECKNCDDAVCPEDLVCQPSYMQEPSCIKGRCTLLVEDYREDVCEPDCEGKECGYDGCGSFCGTCPEGDECVGGQCFDMDMCTCKGDECDVLQKYWVCQPD